MMGFKELVAIILFHRIIHVAELVRPSVHLSMFALKGRVYQVVSGLHKYEGFHRSVPPNGFLVDSTNLHQLLFILPHGKQSGLPQIRMNPCYH